MTVLQLDGVSKTYTQGFETIRALDTADFSVEPSEFVVVTGPSGSGKSTLLHVAGGLDAPDAGTVTFGGEDIFELSAKKRAVFRRRHLGFVFQFFNLVPTLTAQENVSLPLLLDGARRNEADARAADLLDRLGLGDRLDHRPNQLSGGQMQRVAVARALVAGPDLVLADEPTGNLDSHAGRAVIEALEELASEQGSSVVLVTHDEEAERAGTRTLRLLDGKLSAA